MTPYYGDGQVTLYQGDVREVLRALPDGSVNCVVTSPPYWSLRDYGVEATVWGGGGGCAHEWGETVEQQRGGTYSGKTRWQHIADEANEAGVPVRTISPESWGLEDGHPKVASGQFCSKCGAWLGALGLEPTPELFVAHMVEVFREVRRLLRPDGTLWLNIGDSYAGGGRGGNPTAESSTLEGGMASQEASMSSRSRGSTLPAGLHESVRLAGGVGRAWVPPPAGLKSKDLVGIPWMLAFALRADGWWLRQDIIWSKPNPMPESVQDRCTKAHEYLFLLSKSERYWSDFGAIRERAERPADNLPEDHARASRQRETVPEPRQSRRNSFARATSRPRQPGEHTVSHRADREHVDYSGTRNKRSVWHIPTAPFPEAHFATFPPALVEPCILAGCPEGGIVLDPFIGSGTTAMVARQLGRRAVGIDLNGEYLEMARRRDGPGMLVSGWISPATPMFSSSGQTP